MEKVTQIRDAASTRILTAELREFLDSIIVPLLVKRALGALEQQNEVESDAQPVPECANDLILAEAAR